MTSPSSSLPPIEVGTHLTDFSSLDLEVQDSDEGGYGLVVWGPNHAQGSQMTALKLLRPDLLARANAISPAEGARLQREFEREALIWCHLWPHATIIATDGLNRLPGWDNMPVLELEYAPRGSVRRALSEAHGSQTGHLSLRAALMWGQQIAAALAVIHQPDPACERPEPLIHCDLKPENVLLNEQRWAKLTDLGLTRAYATTTAPAADDTALSGIAQATGEAPSDEQAERVERVARMRQALQAAGLIGAPSVAPTAADAPFPQKPGTVRTAQDTVARVGARRAEFPTRSVRVPYLPTTLLAVQTAVATEQAIGSRGPVAGTPPYMPPEQWWGLDAVLPASDIYALGVLLFELFTGGAWSPQQQRWLDAEEASAADTASTSERYVRFPHAPQFNAEAQAYLEGWGGSEGQQAYFAAWYAAHRAGPRWRLADPAVGALTRGPLAEIAAQGEQASEVARALSDLIERCLATDAARRPTAESAQRRLGEIARLAGSEPLVIPDVYPRTPAHQAGFWGNLAMTYSHLGQHKERLRLQQQAVTLDPEAPHHWMNLGGAFDDLERYEEALDAYVEAERRLTPAFQAREPQRAARLAASIPNNQGIALRHLERYEEAVVAYRRVLALRPDWADTRFNLALALGKWSEQAGATREQRLERLRAARAETRRALDDAPGYEKARRLLGQIERALAALEGA